MNGVDLLVSHHRRLEGMLEKLADANGEEERARLFGEAADFLATHVSIEEEIFYPAVKAKRTEDILLESLEEHLSLKRVLADLLGMEASDERYEPKLHVLKEQAEHHHKEEEEHLFPKVRKLLDEERLEEVGREMEQRVGALLQGQPRKRVLGQTDEAAPL
jgi:hemerythrin superfamily protein